MPSNGHRRVEPHVSDRLRARRDALLGQLTGLLEAHWHHLARTHFPGDAPPAHAIEFSPRITSSWALIYYRRHLIRLSPYLFLLDADELRHGSYWRELDATLRHEIVHAHLFAKRGETGHPPDFGRHLARLGVDANGCSDLGPTNVAFRHVYECARCKRTWRRRARLPGNLSCARCGPGGYDPSAPIVLAQTLPPPYDRLAAHATRIAATIEEATRDLVAAGAIRLEEARVRRSGSRERAES